MSVRDCGNSAVFCPSGYIGRLRRVAAVAKPLSSGNRATLWVPSPAPARRIAEPLKIL
jgi:hypothetical protein